MVYEPTCKSIDVHFWTECNLKCRACYTHFETLDFGLYDDPVARVANRDRQSPPEHFLSLDDVMRRLKGFFIERAIFIGTEPALDPEMPTLAASLHSEFNSYNVLLTNGAKLAEMNDIDEVIFSIKAISPELHRAYTGRDNRQILKNFALLHERGLKVQAETVLVPGLIEADEVSRVAEFVSGINPGIPLRIDAYFPVSGCPWQAASREEVEKAAALSSRYLKKISILTLDMKRTGEKPIRIV